MAGQCCSSRVMAHNVRQEQLRGVNKSTLCCVHTSIYHRNRSRLLSAPVNTLSGNIKSHVPDKLFLINNHYNHTGRQQRSQLQSFHYFPCLESQYIIRSGEVESAGVGMIHLQSPGQIQPDRVRPLLALIPSVSYLGNWGTEHCTQVSHQGSKYATNLLA